MKLQKITPFLWFEKDAEEAMKFYVSIFKNSREGKVVRYGKGAPLPEGTVLTASFTLEEMNFVALNGGPQFKFNPAISFVINCDDQKEVDYYWNRLTEGGTEEPCGWLKDRFGVSWQVVPGILPQLLQSEEPGKAGRVMQAFMKMKKFVIKDLVEA